MIAPLPLSPVSDEFYETQNHWLPQQSKGLVSVLDLTVMREYPSPSRTPRADSTTRSSSPTPFTPPQGLDLVDLDFSNPLFTDFPPPAGPSAPVSATSAYWPEMSMISNTSTGQGQYGLLAPGSYNLPTCSTESPAFYSPALSSSAYSTFRSASPAEFSQCAVHDDPYNHPAPYNLISGQPNDRQAWLNNEMDMNMPRVGMRLLHSQDGHTPSVSSSTRLNPAAFPSPANILGSFSGPESPAPSINLPVRPNRPSDGAGRKYFPLASVRRISKVQKRESSIERRYTCPMCNRGFKKHSNLKDHEQKHDTNRLPPYVCSYDDCNKRLGRKTDLARHINAVHKNEKGFICSKCQKGFGRKDTLNRHTGACPFSRTFGDLAGPEPRHSSPMPGIPEGSPFHRGNI